MFSNTAMEEPVTKPGVGECSGSSAIDDMMLDCLTKAREMLRVLIAESEALRRFNSEQLLGLIHQKEYSLNVLHSSLQVMKKTQGFCETSESNSSRSELKELLSKIKHMNDLNRRFIEGSLDYYSGLFAAILPSVYGQGRSNPTHPLVSYKGVSLRREA